MPGDILLMSAGIVLLLAGNAFFVAAEFALVAARRSAIEPKAFAGSKRAKTTLLAMENVSVMMAGAQLGITMCSLGLGAIGEPAIAHLLEQPLHDIGAPDELLHPIAFAIALAVMTFLHVVIGEMIPKNITLALPEKAALIFGPSHSRLVTIIKPFVVALNNISIFILKIMGVTPKDEITSAFTRDEVAGLIEESRREGLLSDEKEQLLSGSLDLHTQQVGSAAVPLTELKTVSRTTSPADIEAVVASTGFSRIPVVSTKGAITGYVHIKDILKLEENQHHERIPATIIRNLVLVKEHDTLQTALTKMQRAGSHMALVSARGGDVVGVVTFEDVLEELVGEME